MVLVDGQGIPLGVLVEGANRAECRLAEETLAQVAVPRPGRGRPRNKPARIIADKAYDSRALRERLESRGIDLIVPHRSNLKNKTQDGRKLRRYRRRWIVERTIAWLLNLRRLTVRWERKAEHYLAFLHLACAMIALRRVLK
jgi:transposase